MKLGIKLGPDNESYDRFLASHAAFVEIWYNANTPDAYLDVFDKLNKQRSDIGLHFWAHLPDQTLTNLAYPDADLINQTIKLIQQTIDTASANGCSYVNIHPGNYAKVAINFQADEFISISEPVDLAVSTQLFLEHVMRLHTYAKDRNILLTVETVPQLDMNRWYEPESRNHPIRTYQLPISVLVQAAALGINIANDFTHTATQTISDDPQVVWASLHATTATLAPNTRLIHIGFIVPPYNGTDFHDSFENPLFMTNHAVPNHDQMIELLRLFKNRSDVRILAEPARNHVENYVLVEKLLQEASKPDSGSVPD